MCRRGSPGSEADAWHIHLHPCGVAHRSSGEQAEFAGGTLGTSDVLPYRLRGETESIQRARDGAGDGLTVLDDTARNLQKRPPPKSHHISWLGEDTAENGSDPLRIAPRLIFVGVRRMTSITVTSTGMRGAGSAQRYPTKRIVVFGILKIGRADSALGAPHGRSRAHRPARSAARVSAQAVPRAR